MKEEKNLNGYSPQEERFNIITHGLGFFLSVIATVLLIIRAFQHGGIEPIVSFTIFGGSLMVLYAASTLYHSAQKPKARNRLHILDHVAIYVLIAGTYTPFTLVSLNGRTGWLFFSITWTLAISGIVWKLFFTGKYKLLSTILYVLMGCLIIFAIKPLASNVPIMGIYWLLGGGLSYILGAGFYSIKKIKFNHAIFHLFVLMGSFCHFMAIYFFVLPG